MSRCVRRVKRLPLRNLLALLTAACATAPTAAPSAPECPAGAQCLRATVGASETLTLEVADTPEERSQGLTGRSTVPARTGMIFVYDAPSRDRYYMYKVPVPLTAVFISGGAVVGVVDMPPCSAATPQECPTYGVDSEFDRVVETAPETLSGKVSVGDRLTVVS